MNELQKTLARKHFDFLIDEYRDSQFTYTPTVTCVRYDAPHMYLELWMGRGDDDVLIGVKGDTAKIRPGDAHTFTFQKVIRAFHPTKFPKLSDFPSLPNETEDEHRLRYYAHWIKKHLSELLMGNVALLDKVVGR